MLLPLFACCCFATSLAAVIDVIYDAAAMFAPQEEVAAYESR